MDIFISMTLKHAKHNEKACKHLNSNGEFKDWIITTAFYSAIHYVDHSLFPNQYEDPSTKKIKHFKSLDFYFTHTDRTKPKHEIRHDLVDEHLPEISDQFQTLKENCSNARYVDYRFDKDVSDLCVTCLDDIKEICDDNSN